MKILKVLMAIALVTGLIVGVVPALASSIGGETPKCGQVGEGEEASACGEVIDGEEALACGEVVEGNEASACGQVVEGGEELCEEGTPCWEDLENSAEEMLEYISKESFTEDARSIGCGCRHSLFTGLVTNMITGEGGAIDRLTVLNRYARQVTFKVVPDTQFYYDESAVKEVKVGSLITVVHNPWAVSCPSNNGCDDTVRCTSSSFEACPSADVASENVCVDPGEVPILRWTTAAAVLVHGPRPWLINGAVSDIDLAGSILTVTLNGEDTQVKVNNDTTFVLLPGLLRMATMESLEEDDGNEMCGPNRPELSDIQIGAKVAVYAPYVNDEGMRVGKIVVVFPWTPLETISGTISLIDEDQKTITLTGLENDTLDNYCGLAFSYTDSTVIVLRGSLSVEVGDYATAQCWSDDDGNLTAVKITIR